MEAEADSVVDDEWGGSVVSVDVILYGASGSGHAYKVRMALMMAGVEHRYQALDLLKPRAERDHDWRRASRFGEVPVLVWESRALSQSNAILLHLMRRGAAPGASADLDGVTEWLGWEANRIGLCLPNYRAHRRGEAPVGPEIAGWLEARLRADLSTLEARLAASPWLQGEDLTVADLSCAAYLLYRDTPGFDLSAWPAINEWLERIAERPGWGPPAEVMV